MLTRQLHAPLCSRGCVPSRFIPHPAPPATEHSRFVNDEDHAMAALGPVGRLPDYDWIRNRTIVRQ